MSQFCTEYEGLRFTFCIKPDSCVCVCVYMWGVTSVCAGSVGKVAGLLQEDTHTHTQALLHWSITTAASKRENCFSISIQKHFAWEHKLTYKHRFTLKREVESEMQPYLKKVFIQLYTCIFFSTGDEDDNGLCTQFYFGSLSVILSAKWLTFTPDVSKIC